ncbi:RluA family pseudouridine synthase [Flexithrix dorotheae]|uniref:RluA family pseudouridine synthase n=1 Tax=Flexithrix dorotheae TaxID=70993 RepID=UPI000376E007|nr:RluA family pseudouridine synthase [Flexithrix dorotheae]
MIEENDEELFEHFRIEADPKQSLLRIDKFLIDRLPHTSRNRIQDAIKQNYIKVNGDDVKSNYKIRPKDVVTIFLPKPKVDFEIIPQDIPLNIVFEDDHLMIINKEPGMVVHPGHNNWDGTLVNALAFKFKNLPTHKNGEQKPGLVHRIDKDTSGLLVIAKTDQAMTNLAKQFFDHSIERTYYALVWGEVKEDNGTIEGHIGRSFSDRRMSTVFPDGEYGKEAITHYQVLKRLRYVSLVKCNLETGRTHQIRAHMKYLGHTLFNDALYGGDKILKGERFSKYKSFVENCFSLMPRQALHAKTLGFIHPVSNEFIQFDSEIPEDFQSVIDRWEHYVQYT